MPAVAICHTRQEQVESSGCRETGACGRFSALARKIQSQGRLLFREPARFVENLEDAIRPEKYRKKLLGFQSMPPLQVRIDADAPPHCNVLVPVLAGRLTGGPNTVFNIACGLAESGDTRAPPRDGWAGSRRC